MRYYLVLALSLCLLALSFAALTPASAQQQSNVIADGLNNPRALAFDADGVLWIGEAGTAGDLVGPTDLGPVKYGGSARLLKVVPGKAGATVAAGGFPSAAGFDDIIGLESVFANQDGLWVVTGLGPNADPFDEALIDLDPKTYRVKQFVDLYSFEAQNNPDQDVVMSDPSDVAQGDDGTYYLVDASGNDLLTWTPSGGLKLFHVWMDLPVPTSVDIGPDGSIYVGFLSPYPYDPGSARIEQWSPQGQLLKTYSGLTAVTDVLVDSTGTIYAVQFSDVYGDLGWDPNSGSVVTVSDSGLTPVAQDLNFPYRLAESPDGGLAVTVNSAFSAPNSGEVIALSGEFTTLPAGTPQAPISTEEVPTSTAEAQGGM